MEDSDRRGGGGGAGDTAAAPLLAAAAAAATGGGGGATSSQNIPVMLGRATSRRLMRAPQSSSTAAAVAAMRETAALQLEERHYDWGYSKPVVALDLVWNLAFVLVSASVLLSTARERPSTPIRAWIFGYAVQCLLHVGFVCFEYRRRRRRRTWRRIRWVGAREEDGLEDSPESRDPWCNGKSCCLVTKRSRVQVVETTSCENARTVKKLESLNAMISLLWWMLGFYWIVVGGQALLQDAPRLYWLTVVFLAFDVFFAIFCIMLACIIGIALCCCLPCIIAFLYAVAGQEGASDADLSRLLKFRFRRAIQPKNFDLEKEQAVAVTITEQDSISDLALPPEDSECCICLCQYEDGAELHSLPCNHHFHSGCIVRWLRINATCPLCKYNILQGDEYV